MFHDLEISERDGDVMSDIRQEIACALEGAERIIISNQVEKSCKYRRVEVRMLMMKGQIWYQFSRYTEKQAFQSNVAQEALLDGLLAYFPAQLCQMNLYTADREYSFRVTKKGKLLKNMKRRGSTKGCMEIETRADRKGCADMAADEPIKNTHNRRKNYILEEGNPIPPLVDMGIFTKEGRVVHSMYGKFKQINRFVEMVDDVLKEETKEEFHIIDFGCGKSYLTFIVYYYLTELQGKHVHMTGLDLKEEVIEKCNRTARKYGYDGLHFELGDINGYRAKLPVDMVITLHACDTATDYALDNAVRWGAKYILSVPCCQHEVNGQIDADRLAPMMRYGIIRERMAALATDALRGCMLEYRGYRTQLMEFVDMAHSPKNILIRAVKSDISERKREQALREAEEMCQTLHIEPSIYRLLGKE